MLISLYFYFFNFKIISKKTTLISVVFFPCKSKVENSKSTDQTQNILPFVFPVCFKHLSNICFKYKDTLT